MFHTSNDETSGLPMKQLELQALLLHSFVVLLSVTWMQNTQGVHLAGGQLQALLYMHLFAGQQAFLGHSIAVLVLLRSPSLAVGRLLYAQFPI